MYKRKRRREINDDEARLAFIDVVLHDCHVFLQKWKVLIPNRTEETQDAFIAITELEIQLMDERSELVRVLGVDPPPF